MHAPLQDELFPAHCPEPSDTAPTGRGDSHSESQSLRSSECKGNRSFKASQLPSPQNKAAGSNSAPTYQRYLAVDDVAQMFAVSVPTIWPWAKENIDFPSPYKLSPGTSRWCLCELQAFETKVRGAK